MSLHFCAKCGITVIATQIGPLKWEVQPCETCMVQAIAEHEVEKATQVSERHTMTADWGE